MKAELIDSLGSDLTVVNAARVSFDKESEWEIQGTEFGYDEDDKPTCKVDLGLFPRDAKLIHYLARHNHFTPFTHCMVTMRETVPIFVARQRFKHVVGFSYNEVSRRYVDSEPAFYTPVEFRYRAENVKQGSSLLSTGWGLGMYGAAIKKCLETYNDLIAGGICPEQARMVLPQSMFTSYYVTGSLAAWARAYKLRTDPHAQKEIQDLATQWDAIIRPLFPVSWAALTEPTEPVS